MVLEGPDLERNKVARWRCADLQAEIASRWSVSKWPSARSASCCCAGFCMTRLQNRGPIIRYRKTQRPRRLYKPKTSPAW